MARIRRYALVEKKVGCENLRLFAEVMKTKVFYDQLPVNGQSRPGMEAIEIVLNGHTKDPRPIGHMIVIIDRKTRMQDSEEEQIFGDYESAIGRYRQLMQRYGKSIADYVNLFPVIDVKCVNSRGRGAGDYAGVKK